MDLFMYAYNRVSSYELEGNRRKPQRVTRNRQVTALLKKVIKEPDGTPIYATADDNRYTCIVQKGHIVHKDRFTASIKVIDEVFLGRFLQQILQLQLMDIGWEDKL